VLVVLKVFEGKLAGHARDLYALSARLHHPNIIGVLEMGDFEGNFFCALEYIERTLADRLRDGPLPGREVARLARAVGSALQYALDQDMIPWSLSPNSILLTDENVPKLMDLRARETFGRLPDLSWPALMPPEWVSGADTASEAGQVYRMGALMYEMLTAKPPFSGDNPFTLAKRVLHEMPVPPGNVNPGVGRGLDAVCMTCLTKDPTARYASLAELGAQLEPFEPS
jgi:serine/threonine-protein kinase